MPKKKDKFYICILWIISGYNTIKSHKKDALTGLIILTLMLEETSPGCHADLFISGETYFGGCSIVGKPLCYHASNSGSIQRGGYTNRFPYILVLLDQLSLPSFCSEVSKWVPDNTAANSGSSTMKIAPIDHHWWYDQQLHTYNSGSVGRTHVNWVDGTSVQVCVVVS